MPAPRAQLDMAADQPQFSGRRRGMPLPVAISFAFVLLLTLSAVFAPWVAPFPENAQSLRNVLKPPAWLEGGDPRHLLGTDRLGRDILTEIIYGARVSLSVGLGAVAIGLLVGVPLGMVAGYFRGVVDQVVSRLIDVQLAIPLILLALLFVTVVGPGKNNVILIQGLVGWLIYARLARAQVLTFKERAFVESARAIGARAPRILFVTLLPNIVPSLIAVATLEIGRNIITETSLSFLGVGVMPPDASWGRMIAGGRDVIFVAWWIPTWPGLAITLTVLAFALIGDWLRDRYGRL